MEDTKKNVELNSEDLDEVSAGSGEPGNLTCDMCGRSALEGCGRTVIPFQGGHVCISCLRSAEAEFGRKLL